LSKYFYLDNQNGKTVQSIQFKARTHLILLVEESKLATGVERKLGIENFAGNACLGSVLVTDEGKTLEKGGKKKHVLYFSLSFESCKIVFNPQGSTASFQDYDGVAGRKGRSTPSVSRCRQR